MISVASNFYAANFKQNTGKDPPRSQARRRQKSQRKLEQDESVDIPDSWPDDIYASFTIANAVMEGVIDPISAERIRMGKNV